MKKDPKNGEILWKKIVNNSSLAIKEEGYLIMLVDEKERSENPSYIVSIYHMSCIYVYTHTSYLLYCHLLIFWKRILNFLTKSLLLSQTLTVKIIMNNEKVFFFFLGGGGANFVLIFFFLNFLWF